MSQRCVFWIIYSPSLVRFLMRQFELPPAIQEYDAMLDKLETSNPAQEIAFIAAESENLKEIEDLTTNHNRLRHLPFPLTGKRDQTRFLEARQELLKRKLENAKRNLQAQFEPLQFFVFGDKKLPVQRLTEHLSNSTDQILARGYLASTNGFRIPENIGDLMAYNQFYLLEFLFEALFKLPDITQISDKDLAEYFYKVKHELTKLINSYLQNFSDNDLIAFANRLTQPGLAGKPWMQKAKSALTQEINKRYAEGNFGLFLKIRSMPNFANEYADLQIFIESMQDFFSKCTGDLPLDDPQFNIFAEQIFIWAKQYPQNEQLQRFAKSFGQALCDDFELSVGHITRALESMKQENFSKLPSIVREYVQKMFWIEAEESVTRKYRQMLVLPDFSPVQLPAKNKRVLHHLKFDQAEEQIKLEQAKESATALAIAFAKKMRSEFGEPVERFWEPVNGVLHSAMQTEALPPSEVIWNFAMLQIPTINVQYVPISNLPGFAVSKLSDENMLRAAHFRDQPDPESSKDDKVKKHDDAEKSLEYFDRHLERFIKTPTPAQKAVKITSRLASTLDSIQKLFDSRYCIELSTKFVHSNQPFGFLHLLCQRLAELHAEYRQLLDLNNRPLIEYVLEVSHKLQVVIGNYLLGTSDDDILKFYQDVVKNHAKEPSAQTSITAIATEISKRPVLLRRIFDLEQKQKRKQPHIWSDLCAKVQDQLLHREYANLADLQKVGDEILPFFDGSTRNAEFKSKLEEKIKLEQSRLDALRVYQARQALHSSQVLTALKEFVDSGINFQELNFKRLNAQIHLLQSNLETIQFKLKEIDQVIQALSSRSSHTFPISCEASKAREQSLINEQKKQRAALDQCYKELNTLLAHKMLIFIREQADEHVTGIDVLRLALDKVFQKIKLNPGVAQPELLKACESLRNNFDELCRLLETHKHADIAKCLLEIGKKLEILSEYQNSWLDEELYEVFARWRTAVPVAQPLPVPVESHPVTDSTPSGIDSTGSSGTSAPIAPTAPTLLIPSDGSSASSPSLEQGTLPPSAAAGIGSLSLSTAPPAALKTLVSTASPQQAEVDAFSVLPLHSFALGQTLTTPPPAQVVRHHKDDRLCGAGLESPPPSQSGMPPSPASPGQLGRPLPHSNLSRVDGKLSQVGQMQEAMQARMTMYSSGQPPVNPEPEPTHSIVVGSSC